ncbi:MAG: dihydrofolate reductase [Bacteroidales bacterium]|nr:dihydrofolate reductase [Bacteroidales bacterium]
MKKPLLSIIVAIDSYNGIGKAQKLLCHLPDDLKHFKTVTSGHTVIMGRKTFESLPNGALPNRRNIVLSSNPAFIAEKTTVCKNLDSALALSENEDEVFIIGGASVYKEALDKCDRLYLTRIHHHFKEADTFFPSFNQDEWSVIEQQEYPDNEKNPYPYTFVTLQRK